MFFKMIRRNSRKNRRENGIFFGSLVAAVVLFYIILSLENQDVMQFLSTIESDAVNRLLGLVPVLYGFSLFLIFFLVYFAGKYQLERRSHEFGSYLMLGMKRSRLFGLLIAEDMWNSVLALLAGLPLAVFLSEMVSLITSRLVGLGIIGSHSSFSLKAVLLTAAGFFAVKILAFLILSGKIAGREISVLMKDRQEEKLREEKKGRSLLRFLAGVILLLAAYGAAVAGYSWRGWPAMAGTAAIGCAGTFLLFSGLGKWLETVMAKKRKRRGLTTFTYRQLQENVFLKHRSMAVSSLLILMALVCFAYGIAIGWTTKGGGSHGVDFTFTGEESDIREQLDTPELKKMLGELTEVKAGLFLAEEIPGEEGKPHHEFGAEELHDAVEQLEDTEEKRILQNNLQYFTSPYVISLSGYNEILKKEGKRELRLGENETALYADADFSDRTYKEVLKEVCRRKPRLLADGEQYEVADTLYTDNFVADRAVTIDLGLIIPDAVFDRWTEGEDVNVFWNASVSEKLVEEKGLLRAVMQVNDLLKKTGLTYESYLQSMGRQMFYNVASTYVSLYLAVIFLIIANTIISVQLLMQQKKNGRRYRTLLMLGSDERAVCRSSDTQIRWYFGLTVTVAVVSSIFGIGSLFAGILPTGLASRAPVLFQVAVLAAVLLGAAEYVYITVVIRSGRRYVRQMIQPAKERVD